jgi:hypothetical protein
MHDQAMPPADPRAEFIAALRDLAGYLTEHPYLPISDMTTTCHVFPDADTDSERQAGVDRFATMTGAEPTEHNGHYMAAMEFGRIAYVAVAISDAARAIYRAELTYAGCVEPGSGS